MEKVRAKDRERAAAIPAEEKRAKHKQWRDANIERVRECAREIAKRLYALDPEKFRKRSREWYQANLDDALAWQREYKAKNRERMLEYAKKYRADHLDKVKANLKAYRARPEYKKLIRFRKQKERDDLNDNYIKRVLFPKKIPSSIPRNLIELKREQLTVFRLTKKLNQEITNQKEKDNGN